MKKHYYLAAIVHDNNNGKNWAGVITVRGNENLLNYLSFRGITAANICESKAEAERLAEYWNESFRNNGTYLEE